MRIVEPLNNGLVTSRAPIMLSEGELQQADGVYYQPNDPGVHFAPAFTQADTGSPFATGGNLSGLAACTFDFLEATCNLVRASTTINVTPLVIASVSTTTGSAIITAPATNNFIGIFEGATVTGTGIPASTTVLTWDSPIQITLSANATATGTATLTFTNTRFSNVTAGATISGRGIPDGATVSSVGASNTSLVLSSAATLTTTSRVTVKADSLLVVQVEEGATKTYKKGKLGSAGTSISFSNLKTGITAGTALDQVHYGNQHVLLNGKHENLVLMSDGRIRPHGLSPVTSSCTLSIISGSWALKEGAGFYAYWTTEYDSINDIESDFDLGVDSENKPVKPPIIQITSPSTQAVSITRPQRFNATTTHWRLYRSIKYTSTTANSAAKENKYPNGFLVAQLELRDDNQQNTVTDGGAAASTASVNAGAAASDVGSAGLTWANTSAATGAINNGGATDDTNSATLTSLGGFATNNKCTLTLSNFSIPTVSAPVTGLSVSITGRKVNAGELSLNVRILSQKPGIVPDQILIGGVVPFTTSNSTITLGGTGVKWGKPQWDPSEFANGRFFIDCTGYVPRDGFPDKVTVDAVSVIVFHGETQETGTGTLLGNTTDPYPAVVVSPFGFTISAGRGGKPPKSSTGDIFQDSLVVNDVNDSSIVRYSFPTRLDSFPAPYFLNFDTKEQDEVTFIRTVGNVAVIGLKHQIYRVNYLPRDTDSEFDRGRAVEIIEHAHGIAGRSAGALFTLPGVGQMLAYMNNYGIFMTDGYRARPLTPDIDWWGMVDITRLNEAKLVNNTELHLLELYYPPADAGGLQKKLFFHYHSSHLKGDPRSPSLKVSGPHVFPGPDSIAAVTSAGFPNGTRKVYVGSSNVIAAPSIYYVNRLGNSNTAVLVKTRAIPAAQLGNEWRVNEIAVGYTVRDYYTPGTATFDLAAVVTKTGAADRTSVTRSITVAAFPSGGGETNPKSRRISKVVIPETGQAIAVSIDPTACTFRNSFDFITIDAEGQGLENPT
jgi:hypothetical protein